MAKVKSHKVQSNYLIYWRRGSESNRRRRLSRPLHYVINQQDACVCHPACHPHAAFVMLSWGPASRACRRRLAVLLYDYFRSIPVPLAATSLKLPKTLKIRITRLAKRAGESPHAFMLRLLEEQVQAVERFEQFLAEARQADERMQEGRIGYA